MTLPEPHLIDRDPAQIRREIRERYEELTGRVLQPAQLESIYLDLLAYRETLVRIGVQQAGLQNLLRWAQFPMIDHLGALLRVPRLDAQAARTTLAFELPAPRGVPSPIPQGYAVGSRDGRFRFETATDLVIAAGETVGTVAAVCTVPGPSANGYIPGQVSEPSLSLGFEFSVENLTETTGGAPQESTEAYRLRIPLEVSGRSVAGPELAYARLARGASPEVIDAKVLSPESGLVQIVVLVPGGASPELLELVEAACSARDVRPLTDTVTVVAAEPVTYDLELEVTLYPTTAGEAAGRVEAVRGALLDYTAAVARLIAVEPVESWILSLAHQPGVHSAVLASSLPEIGEAQCATVGEVTVTLVGFTTERPVA